MQNSRQHYVLNMDPRAEEVFDFIRGHRLECSVHLNRTRFWVPVETSLYTEFALRFSHTCPLVDLNADLHTGLSQ